MYVFVSATQHSPFGHHILFFLLVGIASGKTNKFNSSIKRIWSAYIGQAAATYALTGAIPLLLAASTF